MKILFAFYVPSGGVETLNRLRCETLRQYGVEGHLLYTSPGSGLQNISNTPTYVTNYDEDISQILEAQKFDAIVVTSDYLMTQRLRRLHFPGPIIFEAQGFGTMEQAHRLVQDASSYLQSYCQAVLLPPTSHLIELFNQVCPWLRQFIMLNMVDTSVFHPHEVGAPPRPILGWVGRLEKNKNWTEYLTIGHRLSQLIPDLELHMLTDETLAAPEEQHRFKKWVANWNLTHRLQTVSNVPHSQMPIQYSRVAASGGFLLSTSMVEGFGYAVAEAIACGCPVVSTDSDGVRLFIKHNQTGKFYSLGNIDQAVNEGLDVMRNLPLRQYIREQGIRLITESFAPAKYAEAFIHMMNSLDVS
ncbi:glycosyltransferase [Paenibacillus sp. YPG26]|uniref:glycosyltransferase family 4 protein n=1 Tax=Paenibacillus sp. YPG26 TaxID=2878915 RepID=UPI00203DE33B|nr:glycosyltransferase [Paenibacillus sp. YPG26]USB32468.1 glycosyltransferase [Paenibacillus sp. YPG26]